MAIAIGTRLGLYEIVGRLGAGGMGEVYRARDARLGRDVALKVLPEPLAADANRRARFEREAQVLACLNHPHIAAIYGFEESSSVRALVLELVTGPTLEERIAQGPIPLDAVLRMALQIADALECAHSQNVVHRDLKPANIKVTASGEVKVLDFGLAKMLDPAGVDDAQEATHLQSMPGTILGTASYMAPEQARGEPAGITADVWAFGCVLYEMLTRRPAFPGASVSEILSEVLKSEPDWRALPAGTPAAIRRLLERCLQKDPRRRLRDIADVRFEIEEAQQLPHSGAPEPAPPRPRADLPGVSRRQRAAWLVATLAVAVAAVSAVMTFRPAVRTAQPELRLEVATLPTNSPTSFAISPDGRKIVFAGAANGRTRLWVRPLDSVVAQPIPGTESATSPFWSPDGRAVGFFAESALKRVDIDGGGIRVLAPAAVDRGGTWAPDGTILFTRNYTSAVYRVPAAGGTPDVVTQLNQNQGGHRSPQFLPDGRHFLFYAVSGLPDTRGVYVGQVGATGTSTRLFDADAGAVFVPPDHLLFAQGATLFAQRFDTDRLQLLGAPTALTPGLATEAGVAAVSASAQGTIVWRTGVPVESRRRFVWFDRSGRELQRVGEPFSDGRAPALSPDGKRVVFFQTALDGNIDLWILETERGVLSRFTFDPANDVLPVWSPDGQRVLFSSNRNGGIHNLYLKSLGGAPGSEQPFFASDQIKQATDWSSDGKFVLFRSQDPKSGFDLWALPMTGERRPSPIAQTPFDERDGQFSPDGRWIAYQSNESGRAEIYLQRFPGPGPRILVSTGGGAQIRWNRNGRELFYIALDDRLMSVPVRFTPDGEAVVDEVKTLFVTKIGGALQSNFPQQYMVSPDGQRFLMNVVPDDPPTPLTVLLNWNGR